MNKLAGIDPRYAGAVIHPKVRCPTPGLSPTKHILQLERPVLRPIAVSKHPSFAVLVKEVLTALAQKVISDLPVGRNREISREMSDRLARHTK
jgi:hypothetical protein